MKICVTGGCGYVGTMLTQKLLELGHEIIVYDIMWFGNYLVEHEKLKVVKGDIRNTSDLPFDGVDAVIHLANVANDPCADLDSKLSWEVNVLSAMGMVEKAISCGVKQFIYASSGSVYGVKEEAQVTEDLSLVPISDYNKTKMICERVLLSYQDQINIVCIRPATVCGYSPRMRLDLSVNMLTMQALANNKITVFGGNQTRPNIGIYNAGFENISILDIAERVAARIPAEIVVSDSNDPRSYRLNSDKLLAAGFEQKYCVSDAIAEIEEAFKAGILKNEDRFYNIKTMKSLNI